MIDLKAIRQLENIDKSKFIDILTSCLVVVIDTREKEKKNEHITDVFKKYKIKYIREKLDFCDYSFLLDKNLLNLKLKKSSVTEDINFSKTICIERKNSLDEIIQNFTTGRKRFENEFIKANSNNCKFKIIIEDDYINLILGLYRSKASKKSIVASMFTFENRFDTNFVFIKKEGIANYIYNYFKYYLYSII